jgi:uncharacterized protein YacL
MVLHVLRGLFVLLMAGVGWVWVAHKLQPFGKEYNWLVFAAALAIAVLFIAVDVLSPRRKLLVLSGTFLGLLVGLVAAYALSFIVDMVYDQYFTLSQDVKAAQKEFVKLVVGFSCCYLSISFILQTKDDFRFIIPYVEFSRQVRGARPILVDTSVIIDGRIVDIVSTGILESRLIVPRFVLQELQTVADSSDKLKRNRGRRGLDVLNQLQAIPRAEVIIYDSGLHEEIQGVDLKLMALAKDLSARVLTNDYNLCKVAQLQQVDVINLNDLANALKPVVLPGERMRVRVVKPGEEPTQGVGYLEDGTMVVIENGRGHIGLEVEIAVTSVLQTSAGRMIFGRIGDLSGGQRRPKPRGDAPSTPPESPAK